MSQVKQITEDYKRELKWASSIIALDEEMVECIVCGLPVESFSDGLMQKFRCRHGHEMTLSTKHINN